MFEHTQNYAPQHISKLRHLKLGVNCQPSYAQGSPQSRARTKYVDMSARITGSSAELGGVSRNSGIPADFGGFSRISGIPADAHAP